MHKLERTGWFYRLTLPDGTILGEGLPDSYSRFHEDRWRMLCDALREDFPDQLNRLRAIDIACHQGFFSLRLAELGLRSVLSVDSRPEHLSRVRSLARLFGQRTISLKRMDVEGAAFDSFAQRNRFDIVIGFGIMYHLENPIGFLRRLRVLTGKVCFIETQTFSHSIGTVPNGLNGATKVPSGVFAVIDERAELAEGNVETGLGGLCLFPTPDTVTFLLKAAGFSSVVTLMPPPDASPELLNGSRMLFAARV